MRLPKAPTVFIRGEKQFAVYLRIARPFLSELIAGRYVMPQPLVFQTMNFVPAQSSIPPVGLPDLGVQANEP